MATTTSGRGFLAAAVRASGPFAPLVAVAVAVLGLVLVVLGVLRSTVWLPPSTVTGSPVQGSPVLVGAPSLLAGGHGALTVTVDGATPSSPVFVGVAHARDVEAWLGDVSRTEVRADATHPSAAPAHSGTERAAPDPRTADIWVAQAGGAGRATLTWPDASGQWRLVTVGDGAAPAPRISVAWSTPVGGGGSPGLIAVGALLLVVGLLGALALRRARRPAPAASSGPAGSAVEGVAAVRGRRAATPDTARPRSARDRSAPPRHATPATGILRPRIDATPPTGILTPVRPVTAEDATPAPVSPAIPVEHDDEDDDEPRPLPFRQPPAGRNP